MTDLQRLITELSKREMTRKQFLLLVSSSFLGLFGFFRFLQSESAPSLASSDRGVFGEREYGHPSANARRPRDEDVFG